MKVLDYLKYTPKESLEAGAAELLDTKKWRVTRSLWIVLVLITFGLVSWAFLLYQGFRFRSRLTRTYGFIHLAFFALYSNLNASGSDATFWPGFTATMVAVCGIAFPLYVNRELLVCKAERAVLGKTWISRNLPDVRVESNSTVNPLQAKVKLTKGILKEVIEDEKKAGPQQENELNQLGGQSDSESASQAKRVEELPPMEELGYSAPAETDASFADDFEKAPESKDIRADGQARGTRRLDY